MSSLLVRVGADQSSGGGYWNGPVDSRSNEFVYVSIPETKPVREGMEKPYNALLPVLSKFGVSLPARLITQHMHLDPDFDYLTYGDGGERANQLRKLDQGDTIIFYASLKDVQPKKQLVYAIIGAFIIDEKISAQSMPASAWNTNAHSRRISAAAEDLIIRARPKVSGRLRCCIPIGEYRDDAYRVRQDILEAWGGLSVKDGYLQRSARLPKFLEPEKFFHWFQSQAPVLLQTNN